MFPVVPHSPAPFPWIDVVIILALVALNGLFAMAELAIVSARPARLQALADEGSKGAAKAIELARDPGKFLSTVQIGITLIGIVAGAYSGSSLGGPVGDRLAQLGVPAASAQGWGFGIVIAITTYVSLVVGELVPKQVALVAAERLAVLAALPMAFLARAGAPVVWLLDSTTALFFRLIGLSRNNGKALSAEELHLIFAEATNAGVIEEHERQVIAGVVRLADRPVREVMTPRTEVDWIPRDADEATLRERLAMTPHTRIPIADGSVDRIVGVVQARDMLAATYAGLSIDLGALMRRAPVVPDQLDAMDALGLLRSAEVPMLLVHDEYGHFEGIVTPNDLLAAISGEFESDRDADGHPTLVEREDGSMLISGAMPADALADRLGITLPDERDYATAAGHALAVLRRLPEEGDVFHDQGWRYEIVDMDGRKIDKLLLSRETG